MATKRDRPRACWLQILADLARGWSRVRTEAARLLEESSQKCSPARIPKSSQRADQRRRHPDHRQIRRARIQDEIVYRSSSETNWRRQSPDRFGFVRRKDIQIGAQ